MILFVRNHTTTTITTTTTTTNNNNNDNINNNNDDDNDNNNNNSYYNYNDNNKKNNNNIRRRRIIIINIIMIIIIAYSSANWISLLNMEVLITLYKAILGVNANYIFVSINIFKKYNGYEQNTKQCWTISLSQWLIYDTKHHKANQAQDLSMSLT